MRRVDAGCTCCVSQIQAHCSLFGPNPADCLLIQVTNMAQKTDTFLLQSQLSIGALSPTSEMALAIGPCVMVLSIMLSDETGAFAEIPDSLTGLSHLSLIKWGFRGCLSSEFEGLKFDPLADARRKTKMKEPCPPTGEHVLESMGLPITGGANLAAKAQTKLVVANALLTYLVLRVRGA